MTRYASIELRRDLGRLGLQLGALDSRMSMVELLNALKKCKGLQIAKLR